MKRIYALITLLLLIFVIGVGDTWSYNQDYSSYNWASGFALDGEDGSVVVNASYTISALKPIINNKILFRANAFHYVFLYENNTYRGYIRSSTYTSANSVQDDYTVGEVTPSLNEITLPANVNRFRVLIRTVGTGYDATVDLNTMGLFTTASFESIVRMYTVIADTPSNVDSIDNHLNNFLDMLNFNNTFGKLFMAIFITLIMVIIVIVLKGKMNAVLVVGVVCIALFGFIGWIESWLLITVLILTVAFILIRSRTNGGSVDD